MSEPDFESWFKENVPFVRRAAGLMARQLRFSEADAEEFEAFVLERLWENDYLILRKWRGESRLATYVVTVVGFLGREYRVKLWGRWRPSAAAVRLGPTAVELEKLVYRDGVRFTEAAEQLRSRGFTTATDRALADLLARLPRRAPRRTDAEVPLDGLVGRSRADEPLDEEERDDVRSVVLRALHDVIRSLAPLEQSVIRMHFIERHTIADVSRAIGTDQKRLYRVKDTALVRIRERLLAQGITPDLVAGVFDSAFDPPDEPPTEPPGDPEHRPPRDSADARPSNEGCDSTNTDEKKADETDTHSDGDQPGRAEP